MTLDQWLDEPQTVTTRRERMFSFVAQDGNHHTREMMMGWLAAAWNAGIESGVSVPRDEAGRVINQTTKMEGKT